MAVVSSVTSPKSAEWLYGLQGAERGANGEGWICAKLPATVRSSPTPNLSCAEHLNSHLMFFFRNEIKFQNTAHKSQYNYHFRFRDCAVRVCPPIHPFYNCMYSISTTHHPHRRKSGELLLFPGPPTRLIIIFRMWVEDGGGWWLNSRGGRNDTTTNTLTRTDNSCCSLRHVPQNGLHPLVCVLESLWPVSY